MRSVLLLALAVLAPFQACSAPELGTGLAASASSESAAQAAGGGNASAVGLPAGRLAGYQNDLSALRARVESDPYDYTARRLLVQGYQKAGEHGLAYCQAAWLAWFAPRNFAESPAGMGVLRDRRARDRAAAEAGEGAPAMVVAAVDAGRSLIDTCLNGAIAGQAARVEGEVAEEVRRAEQIEGRLQRADPVARAALAHLYLTWDDCLRLEDTGTSRRARPQVLRKAASLAAAVVEWLPKSPGAHLTLATARARLAQLENRAEYWELAIQECEMAEALDPADAHLSEMVWTLHLRAGHWADAKRWQTGGPPAARGQHSPQGKGS